MRSANSEFSKPGLSTPKKAHIMPLVSGFPAENEMQYLQFKLARKLQSSLDVHNTLELFFRDVSESIKLSGILFETKKEQPFEVGRKSKHQAQYNIKGSNANLGTVTFYRKSHFLEEELAALEMFISILFYPLRNALLYRDALDSSLRDTLTQIGNRKAMDLAFNREIKLAQRHKQSLCLLFIDLDHFKSINDRFGHRAGDKVLQHIVSGVQSALRDTDQIFRYGGEEFIVLLNSTNLVAAELIAERIRLYIAITPLALDNNEISATISIGVSELNAADSTDTFLKRADNALYAAKHSGRNRVVCSENLRENTRKKSTSSTAGEGFSA